MIDLPQTWRVVLLIAALGLVPMLLVAQWAAGQLSRSYLGARLRGWWWHSPTHRRRSRQRNR